MFLLSRNLKTILAFSWYLYHAKNIRFRSTTVVSIIDSFSGLKSWKTLIHINEEAFSFHTMFLRTNYYVWVFKTFMRWRSSVSTFCRHNWFSSYFRKCQVDCFQNYAFTLYLVHLSWITNLIRKHDLVKY